MIKFSLRRCTEYLAGSSKWKPLCLLFFGTVVFNRRLEEKSFMAEGTIGG
jgi:hypothetical protein